MSPLLLRMKNRSIAMPCTTWKHLALLAPSCHTTPSTNLIALAKKEKARWFVLLLLPEQHHCPRIMYWAPPPITADILVLNNECAKKVPAMARRYPCWCMAAPAAQAVAKKWAGHTRCSTLHATRSACRDRPLLLLPSPMCTKPGAQTRKMKNTRSENILKNCKWATLSLRINVPLPKPIL